LQNEASFLSSSQTKNIARAWQQENILMSNISERRLQSDP